MYCCWPIYLRIFEILHHQLWTRSRILLYYQILRGMLKHTHVELLIDVDSIHRTRRSESNRYAQVQQQVHAVHRNYRRIWCTMTSITCMVGQLVSTIAVCRFSLGWECRQFWRYHYRFTAELRGGVRWTWSMRNISMILIYRFVQRTKNYPASEKRNSSRQCMIKSITSYIIAICSNVLVTVSALQRSIVYCNSCNLHVFASASNSIQILEL